MGGWRVRDCAVVGAPDFVKGDAPVAFVAFRGGHGDAPPRATKNQKPCACPLLAASPDAIDAAAFKPPPRRRWPKLGAYALPTTCSWWTRCRRPSPTRRHASRRRQLLLIQASRLDASLAERDRSTPIAAMVREWHKTGATTNARLDLATYWDRYTFSHHVVQGRPIVPGGGGCACSPRRRTRGRLCRRAFMRGVHAADADVRVTKRRKALQATVGNQVVLRAGRRRRRARRRGPDDVRRRRRRRRRRRLVSARRGRVRARLRASARRLPRPKRKN